MCGRNKVSSSKIYWSLFFWTTHALTHIRSHPRDGSNEFELGKSRDEKVELRFSQVWNSKILDPNLCVLSRTKLLMSSVRRSLSVNMHAQPSNHISFDFCSYFIAKPFFSSLLVFRFQSQRETVPTDHIFRDSHIRTFSTACGHLFRLFLDSIVQLSGPCE